MKQINNKYIQANWATLLFIKEIQKNADLSSNARRREGTNL